MSDYRLFLMRNGRICGTQEFEAVDDAVAIRLADAMRRGQQAELWSRARPVTAFAAAQDIQPERPASAVTAPLRFLDKPQT